MLCIVLLQVTAQTYFKNALQVNRDKFYSNTGISINKALTLTLNPANENAWANAFNSINLIKCNSPFIKGKIAYAVANNKNCGNTFKIALIELLYNEYPTQFTNEVKDIFYTANNDAVLLATAATYLLPTANDTAINNMKQHVKSTFLANTDNVVLHELFGTISSYKKPLKIPNLNAFFTKHYLPGKLLIFSVQRSNRAYHGLAIIRLPNGSFLYNDDGSLFAVGQLARSASNMPSYLSNGNTPQGIFKFTGFGNSGSFFIGPTTNLQLVMPNESKHCANIVDALSIFNCSYDEYKNLLPQTFKNYQPLYGTYYASKAGRTEIIAHGTTIDTTFYKGKTYYPYPPTAGCLSTIEFWSATTGFTTLSDQTLLTQAIKKNASTSGYLIVIDIDNKFAAVTINDILQFIDK